MTTVASLLVIVVAVYAIFHRADVRLTLGLGALALGALAGKPLVILHTFLHYFTAEQFLLPLGCSVGFAYVLEHTQCDRHLVHLLIRPLRRARPLLAPGVVVVAAAVNVPVVSQAATIATVGAVLVPVLQAARIPRITSGAALLLGSSIGGEFLNPGAPEFRTITNVTGASSIDCVAHAWPLLLLHLAIAVFVFWLLCRSFDRPALDDWSAKRTEPEEEFRISYLKAVIPLTPLAILFLTALPPPFRVGEVPRAWLVPDNAKGASFDSRLVATAMLIGVLLAALTDLRKAKGVTKAFFDGAGFALANIISIIVVANCFGKGVAESGLVAYLHTAIDAVPGLMLPLASALPMAFAWLCGSGMASTQSLYGFFVSPSESLGHDPLRIGAVVSLSAAAGRTMSPAAAVVLLASAMTGAEPLRLVRRVAIPLLCGIVAVVIAAAVMR